MDGHVRRYQRRGEESCRWYCWSCSPRRARRKVVQEVHDYRQPQVPLVDGRWFKPWGKRSTPVLWSRDQSAPTQSNSESAIFVPWGRAQSGPTQSEKDLNRYISYIFGPLGFGPRVELRANSFPQKFPPAPAAKIPVMNRDINGSRWTRRAQRKTHRLVAKIPRPSLFASVGLRVSGSHDPGEIACCYLQRCYL